MAESAGISSTVGPNRASSMADCEAAGANRDTNNTTDSNTDTIPGNSAAGHAGNTSADNMVGAPGMLDTLRSEATTAESLLALATTNSPGSTATAMPDAGGSLVALAAKAAEVLSDDHSIGGQLYRSADDSVVIGNATVDYKAPAWKVETEKSRGTASVGIHTDLTLARGTTGGSLSSLAEVNGSATIATANAHLQLAGHAQFKGLKSSASAKASAGAEAMAVDGKLGGEISITPKTVGDTLGDIYNNAIDPVVDWAAGRDVPGIPPVPDSWDHGITLGGHVNGGFGASAKAGFGLDIGDGNGARISANAKFGLGPVLGAGLSLGVK